MKNKNLIPLALFCIVFLAYSIYFVKVINTSRDLEPNSISKTVSDVIERKRAEIRQNRPDAAPVREGLSQPLSRYVNYTWLNVRRKPTLASSVVDKILKGDKVTVLDFPTASWAYIRTQKGNKGYVARRYLSDNPPAPDTVAIEDKAPTPAPAPTPTPAPAVVSSPTPAPGVDPATVEETVVVSADKPVVFDIPIITYHHISDNTDAYPDSLVLPEINFLAQLDWLASNGFTTYTFHDMKAIVDNEKDAAEKAVVITFNGGYADAYQASQHLNGKGMKAVFYLTTDKIGREGYLDWRQVKKMRSWGMEIGSQGVTGANLVSSTDFYIDDEVSRSKETIEKELGESIISFAYSLGGYTARAIDVVKGAGYLFAKTADSGSRYTDRQLYKLPTLRVFFPAGANQFRVWLE